MPLFMAIILDEKYRVSFKKASDITVEIFIQNYERMAVIYIAPTRLDAACTFAKVFQTAAAQLQTELNSSEPVILGAELQLTHVEDTYAPIELQAPFVWRKPTLELLWVDVESPDGADPFSVMVSCENFSSGSVGIPDFEAGCGKPMSPSVRQDMKETNTYWSISLPRSASSLELRTHHVLAEAIAEVCAGWVYVGE